MKKIITITGIRPDFIRMSEIFKKLDENFEHTLIHSGQHYDKMLSEVFFDELNIRKPDYNLEVGGEGKEHFHQTGELSVKIIELIRDKNLDPDLIIFLGDSNSVVSAVSLKKEGYKIAHIEAGMRSYDRRMLEEINRVVCDHCSDYLFVYHENYKKKALQEGIKEEQIYVVGNTIIEVAKPLVNILFNTPKKNESIILDIHRPENFNNKDRLKNIISYTNLIGNSTNFNLPIKMLNFGRTEEKLKKWDIDLKNIKLIPLMSYNNYIEAVYHSKFIISDSGTAQEEPSLFRTPVIVPRDYTERPESVWSNCSFMIDVNNVNDSWDQSIEYLRNINISKIKTEWLGDGKTSEKIIKIIKSINL